MLYIKFHLAYFIYVVNANTITMPSAINRLLLNAIKNIISEDSIRILIPIYLNILNIPFIIFNLFHSICRI